MMDYNVFKTIVLQRIGEFMPPMYRSFTPVIEEVRKVNEVKDALILKPESGGEGVALPMIYLDDMYEVFEELNDLEEILQFIASVVISYTGFYKLDSEDMDFTKRKDHIIVNLINAENNEELLENLPHIRLMNMAVVYRIIMRESDDGFDSIMVNKEVFKELGMTAEEMHKLAVENTRRIFPPTVTDVEGQFAVISNDQGLFGAVGLIFDDIMKEAGEIVGTKDFFVLPSSIHEVLAFSSDENLEQLVQMLAGGNREFTREKDILSNSIYFYNGGKKSLATAVTYAEKK